jgi:hypothetical protein
MSEDVTDQFPAWTGFRTHLIDDTKVEAVRRILIRAFQRGVLSERELSSTLDRLVAPSATPDPPP